MVLNRFSLAKLRPQFRVIAPGWALVVLGVVTLIALPVLVVFSSVLVDSGETWQHLSETVLPTYLLNSFWLMVGVSIGVLVIGVGTAWLVTLCRFPGSRVFEWALLLPLAAPAYLLAYSYADVFEYFGWFQTTLRAIAGWERATDYWFPNVRSLGGAIAMFTFTLYPYVYMLTRVAFMEQSTATLEASRSLGCGPWRSFVTVALPLARPAIMAGLSLALMETLNDFGTVQYFGVPTFTTGIYRTWFSLGEPVTAAQLAAVLMLFVLALILLERWSRRQARYYQTSGRLQQASQYQLGLGHSLLAMAACFVPIAVGLLVPGGFLLNMTLRHLDKTIDRNFWPLAQHSIILATIAAAIAAVIALILAYGVRLQNGPLMRLGVRIASMGYAIPGSVIAVGILIPVARFDNAIANWIEQTFGISVGLLISGSIAALIFAYLVRFLAVALSTVESGLTKIRPSLDDAARSLGYGPTETLKAVHVPLMGSSLLTAVMLVFVDVMKELPATMVMRPFNFDTLAVKVHQYASDERLIEASAPALMIVLVGLLPVIFLSWQIRRSRSVAQSSGK